MRNQDKYNIENVTNLLFKSNLILLEKEYISVKQKMLCIDSEGYYIYIILSNFLSRGSIGERFRHDNLYSIWNINHYLKIHNLHFVCISDKYVKNTKELEFKCTLCEKIIKKSWFNVNKNDNGSRSHILCPNCDGRTESLHALILKQMFLHYYPDTIVEDKTYRNPKTNKICPTDIVNHRLKIAIEIQSQWHDFPDIKIKDKMKKDFWISKGYSFYDPDIRNYTPLEMCNIFFNIQKLPEWIDYNYSNKLNTYIIQSMLDNGETVLDIGEKLNISPHRIYDAIHNKLLHYPQNYKYIKLVKTKHLA